MLEAMLNDRCHRKFASKKNIQGIAWYSTLGRDISSYAEFQCKTTKSLSLSLSLNRSRAFITVITQIRTFSLKLGTPNKNFETTKYSLKRSLHKK